MVVSAAFVAALALHDHRFTHRAPGSCLSNGAPTDIYTTCARPYRPEWVDPVALGVCLVGVAAATRLLTRRGIFKEMQVLEPLDDLLIEFTERKPDRALSAMVVPPLVRLHGGSPEEVVDTVVRPFVDQHREQLGDIYKQYADDYRATPLLYQPEALLVFASLDRDPYQLREAWPSDQLPIDILDGMAAIWGIDLEEPDT